MKLTVSPTVRGWVVTISIPEVRSADSTVTPAESMVVAVTTALWMHTHVPPGSCLAALMDIGFRFTAMTAAAVLPARSVAVTVMTLSPGWRTTPDADHWVVPEQVPLPPALFDHVTWATPISSKAVPDRLILGDVVE